MLMHLDESPMARSPSPVHRNASPAATVYVQHRRSSSAASSITAEVPGGWNLLNVRSGSALANREAVVEGDEDGAVEGGVLQLYR